MLKCPATLRDHHCRNPSTGQSMGAANLDLLGGDRGHAREHIEMTVEGQTNLNEPAHSNGEAPCIKRSGVHVVVVSQYINQVMTSVVVGALFDAYLLVLRGSNTFVGTVESAKGLSALAFAFPLGWAGDKWPKTLVLRCNAFLGFLSAVFLSFGIPNDNVHLIVAGSVAYAIHNQCLAGLMPALLAEMTTTGEQRMRAMSHLQTANSAGNASGPALQLLFMLSLRTDQWTLSQLHWILCSGLVFFSNLCSAHLAHT